MSAATIAILSPLVVAGASLALAARPDKAAAVVPAFALPAFGSIAGTVSDTGGRAVAGAQVQIAGAAQTWSVQSGPDGRYQMELPEGLYTLTATAGGYPSPTILAAAASPAQTSIVNPTLGCSNSAVQSIITTDTVWTACRPYVLNRTMTVQGARLTVQPGAILKFATGITVAAGGRVEAAGSGASPVIFTSQKDDAAGGDTNGDGDTTAPDVGNWTGIRVQAAAAADLTRAMVRYAGIALDNRAEATLHDSQFAFNRELNNAGTLAVDGGSFADPSGSLLTNTGALTVSGARFQCADYCIQHTGAAGVAITGSQFEGTGTGTAIKLKVARSVWNGRVEGNTFRTLTRGIHLDLEQAGIAPTAVLTGNRFQGVAEAAAMLSGTFGLDSTMPVTELPFGINDYTAKILSGTTLRIQAGAVVKFWRGRKLYVEGSLLAEARPGQEIVFTSDRDDSAGGDSNGDGAATLPLAGDWGGAEIGVTGRATLEHVSWRYAGTDLYAPALLNKGALVIRSSTVMDSGGPAVVNQRTLDAAGVTFERFRTKAIWGPGSTRVVSSRFRWTGENHGVAGGSGLTVLNSTFEGGGRGEGIHIDVDRTAWNGALDGNTFRNMEQAIAFRLTSAGIGPSASLSANRAERVARGTVDLDGSINLDTALPESSLPYGWRSGLRVEAGRTLRIPPGAVFKIGQSLSLNVFGSLIAEGLPGRSITFTSLRDDSVGGDSNGDGDATRPARSDWSSIVVWETATARLRHVDVRYGGPSPTISNYGRTDVRDSVFTNCDWALHTWVPTLTVHYSRFEGNRYGVWTPLWHGAVDARFNYWGADSGPYPLGSGDAVLWHLEQGPCLWCSIQVENPAVTPWLTEADLGYGQLGPVPWADHVNGVNTATGNYAQTVTDARVEGGRGTPVVIQRTYNELDPNDGPFGRGWSFNYGFRLADLGQDVQATLPTGRGARFERREDGTYLPEASIHDSLVKETDGSYTLTDRANARYRFSATGQITQITDLNGNTVTLGYADGHLTGITDAAGRPFTIAWNGERIATVTDPAGQAWHYGYDAGGHLTAVTDPSQGVTTYDYDAGGRLTAIRRKVDASRTLRMVRMEHDGKGRVTAQYDSDDNKTEFRYDDAQRSNTVIDPLGARTVRKFDDLMRQIHLTDPRGNTEAYGFDGNNNLVEHRNKNGYTTRYTYDARGNKLSETLPETPEGRATTTWQYHPQFNAPVQVVDALGGISRFVYDERGNLRAATDRRDKTTRYEYYPDGLLKSRQDPRGNITTFSYQATGLLQSERAPEPFGYETLYEHDALGRLSRVTDALGHVTTKTYRPTGEVATVTDADGTTAHEYDLAGHVIITTDPRRTTVFLYSSRGLLEREVRQLAPGVSAETAYTYDRVGRQESISDPMGTRTVSEYDALGRLSAVRLQAPGSGAAELRAEYEYDGVGNLIVTRDANRNRTLYRYDAVNRLRERHDPDAAVAATFTYDLLGRMKTDTDATGVTLRYDYDAEGNLKETRDGKEQRTAYDYDDVGNQIAGTNPLHQTITYGYDELNRQVRVTNAYNQSTYFAYDAAGNRTSVTDPDGNVTRFTFDARGRVKGVVEPGPVPAVTSYDYDTAGNLVKVTDALNRVREYQYDLGNRLLSDRDPAGGAISYTYDRAGNRLTVRDRNDGLTSYTYDHVYRLTGTNAPGGIETRFSYDANGNRTAMTDGTGTATFAYDGLNRLRRKRLPDGREIAYHYDDASRLAGTTGYDGGVITRTYDPATGQLAAVSGPGEIAARFSYDAAGNRTGISYGNGVTGAYGYDRLGRVEQVTWQDGSGARLAAVGYQYDGRGNLRQRTDGRGSTVYGYDERDRLVRVAAPEATYDYGYDQAGNRQALTVTRAAAVVRTAYAYDRLDRLTSMTESDGTVRAFSWDANGNQLADGRNRYEYDGLNRLVAVTLPDGQRIAYRHDGDGLLVARQVAGTTTQYYYDGSHPYLEVEGGSSSRTLVVGGLALVRESGAGRVWYLTDAHRDVVGLADPAGRLVGSYAYDAFGNPVMENGSVRNPLRYAGEQWDEQAGLYYLRARHYVPGTGRFLTQDSYGGHPDQPWTMHRYMYAGNSPAMWIDPSGQCVKYMDWFCGTAGKAIVDDYGAASQWASDTWASVSEDVTSLGVGFIQGKGEAETYGIVSAPQPTSRAQHYGQIFGNTFVSGEGFVEASVGKIILAVGIAECPASFEVAFAGCLATPAVATAGSALVLDGARHIYAGASMAFSKASNRFPGSSSYKPKAEGEFIDSLERVKPKAGRKRWVNETGEIFEWDSQHGEVERYNKQGKHTGVVDPQTGDLIKPAIAGRKTPR